MFFKPTVEMENKEDVFLPDEPIELITHGKFQKVPFLTGVNSSEGLLCLRGNVFVDTHLVAVLKYLVLDSVSCAVNTLIVISCKYFLLYKAKCSTLCHKFLPNT